MYAMAKSPPAQTVNTLHEYASTVTRGTLIGIRESLACKVRVLIFTTKLLTVN